MRSPRATKDGTVFTTVASSFNRQEFTCVGQLQLCIQHSKARKRIVEDAPKVEQIGPLQGGHPDSDNVLEIVEEAKHVVEQVRGWIALGLCSLCPKL